MKEGKPSGKCMVSRAGYRLRSRVVLGTRICMDLMIRGRAREIARCRACCTWLRFQGPTGMLSRGESGEGGVCRDGCSSDCVRCVTAASSWLKSCPKPDRALAPASGKACQSPSNEPKAGQSLKGSTLMLFHELHLQYHPPKEAAPVPSFDQKCSILLAKQKFTT